jgi:hypothetical protein
MSNDLPITYGHDHSKPIGYFEPTDDGMKLKIDKAAKIDEKMIRNINLTFAPTYEVTKVEDGLVTEVRLLGFGLVAGRPRA